MIMPPSSGVSGEEEPRRRFFNSRERAALYLAADGRCTDPEAQSMLDEAVRNPSGRQAKGSNVTASKAEGNGRTQALRRLRDQRPDLHDDVIAGNLSAHAAAVKAGFRPRTFTVRADDPARAAAVIRKNFTTDQLATLARLLMEED